MCAQAFCAAAAMASDQVIQKPVVADTPEKFAQTAEQIRSEMSAGGRYEFINPGDKGKVETDLNSIAAMLQKAGSVSAMPQQQQIQLFNTQEHLNGVLTHSDSNRLVCERRAPVGTNIPLNTCKTVGEIEKNRRDSQKYMQDHAQDANINSAAMNRSSPAKGG
jgi:hypothetical protein